VANFTGKKHRHHDETRGDRKGAGQTPGVTMGISNGLVQAKKTLDSWKYPFTPADGLTICR